jgi:hypothetical protein
MPSIRRTLSLAKAAQAADGDLISVRGYLLVDTETGDQYLCEELLESFPPQCGGQRLPLSDFAWQQSRGLRLNAGMAWGPDQVTVTGRLRSGVLQAQQRD